MFDYRFNSIFYFYKFYLLYPGKIAYVRQSNQYIFYNLSEHFQNFKCYAYVMCYNLRRIAVLFDCREIDNTTSRGWRAVVPFYCCQIDNTARERLAPLYVWDGKFWSSQWAASWMLHINIFRWRKHYPTTCFFSFWELFIFGGWVSKGSGSTLPSYSNDNDPWQGQSQVNSILCFRSYRYKLIISHEKSTLNEKRNYLTWIQ